MGLLDMFNDPQQAGLLGAAAQILERSGDTSRPYGLGQAMGTGINAYMQTNAAMRARKQQEEQEKQQQMMREMQMQEMQAQQAQAQAAQRRAAQVQEYLAKGPQGTGQMPMGGLQQQQAQAPQQGAPGPLDPYSQRMQRAAYLRQGDFGQEADAEEMNALKFQPKVKNWEKVKVDGKVLYAPFYEGGGYGQPVPLEVAKELHFADSGQSIDGMDQFTGEVKSRVGKKQTLESLASNASAAAGRAQSERHFKATDARAREFNDTRVEENRLKREVGKAPTEFQGKSAAFGLRATEADKVITGLGDKYRPAAINTKQALGDTWLVGGALEAAGNMVLSENDQKAEQAQRDFVNAVLRQESGAAIGPSEFQNAKKQYFPQPGDGPEVIAQKATNRKLAIQGLQSNAGRAAMTAPAKNGGWSIKKVD